MCVCVCMRVFTNLNENLQMKSIMHETTFFTDTRYHNRLHGYGSAVSTVVEFVKKKNIAL